MVANRYYNPQTGRFWNADHTNYLGARGNVLAHNLFAYCENNPINMSDYDGKIPVWTVYAFAGAALFGGITYILAKALGLSSKETVLLTISLGAVGATVAAILGVKMPRTKFRIRINPTKWGIRKDMNSKIIICIKSASMNEKKRILEILNNIVSETKIYLFEVCGISVYEFLDELESEKYILFEDKSHRVIKDLPILYAFSKEKDDVKTFCEYIGQFNEGYMCLYFLENDFELCNKQQILENINKKTLLMIEVEDDGETLEISSNSEEIMKLICEKQIRIS